MKKVQRSCISGKHKINPTVRIPSRVKNVGFLLLQEQLNSACLFCLFMIEKKNTRWRLFFFVYQYIVNKPRNPKDNPCCFKHRKQPILGQNLSVGGSRDVSEATKACVKLVFLRTHSSYQIKPLRCQAIAGWCSRCVR